jgi:hypothetical protein
MVRVEIADDPSRAFDWLQRIANTDVNVCGKRASLQQHRVVKGDVLRRVIRSDGAGPLARRPHAEIGGAETDRIRGYVGGPTERI